MGQTRNRTVDFLDTQFQGQARDGEFALNPFEELALRQSRDDSFKAPGPNVKALATVIARRASRVAVPR